ncbi:hypothetical protein B9Q17_12525 [Marinobacter vinifirmus]|uniref:Integrase catalytic domain-containing protein n=1 Tax=Marinobacter vinifirmus TaxID=355591 RepID=A0A7Z1DTU3_9GAMM|nr:hypothetical protein B9Q17_12525 [Marinobacter vinifirmus]
MEIDFSRPGQPINNATGESFNGRLNREYLDENWFPSLTDTSTQNASPRTYTDYHQAANDPPPMR